MVSPFFLLCTSIILNVKFIYNWWLVVNAVINEHHLCTLEMLNWNHIELYDIYNKCSDLTMDNNESE